MGLTVSLSNALTGMNTTQQGLSVLSRNVSNAGTPGYHRQSLVLKEGMGANSAYARFAGVERAFSESLQRSHSQAISGTGFADLRADLLGRLEMALGKPGSPTSLDTIYRGFESALQAMATSPDDYATRSVVVAQAQTLAGTLNGLSNEVQAARQETENQMAAAVADLNNMLSTLADINERMTDTSLDLASRASLLDARDRMVQGVASLVDVSVTYRPDDTVALMTTAGLGLLDKSATHFEFAGVGGLSPSSLYNIADDKNGVGSISALTPSGLKIDVVDQGVIRSGRLGALIEMRDKTLVQMQAQLDEIASALALALNRVETAGTAADDGAGATGLEVDAGTLQPGNELVLSYTENGTKKTVRVIRVDDAAKLPMDYTGPGGERVLGLDFSGGIGAVATALNTALGGGLTISNPAGSTLRVLDDGVGNTTDVGSLKTVSTVASNQNGGLGLNLFTDLGGVYTNSLDGEPQKRGFAQRITINPAIVADNRLLVQYQSGGSLGDSSRATYLMDRLQTASFSTDSRQSPQLGSIPFVGTTQSLLSQILNYQGTQISVAKDALSTRQVALESVEMRMSAEYGVDIDEEMARLMELQNAYAANARIVSIVQELLKSLMAI